MRGSVGDISPMTGEENGIGIGSTRVAVSTIVCTTEGCTDATSPARRFLRGCTKFGGHELVDSPDEPSLPYPLYFGLFRVLFVVRGRIWRIASTGAEVEGKINSVRWPVGGGAIITSEVIFC